MNFSLVNPSVPEFPNSDFFIPDFSLRRKKKSPACKGGVFYMLILIPYI